MKIPQKLRAYADLKAFLEQPTFSAQVTLDIQVEEAPFSADGTLHKLTLEDQSVWALETEAMTLGYHEGAIYLENGKAYSLGSHLPQSISLPDNPGFFLPSINIEKDGDQVWYQFQLSRKQTQEISPELMSLTLVMETEAEKLLSLHLSAAFAEEHVALLLQPVESTGYTLPEAMDRAIRTGVQPETEDLIGDILPLLSGFGDYFAREIKETHVTLSADCGPLDLSDSFLLTSGTAEGINISTIVRDDLSLYVAEGNIYTEEGRLLMEGEENSSGGATADTTQILGLAYALCLNGDYDLARQEETLTYTISLDETGMKELSQAILPESAGMEILFDSGVLKIEINGSTLCSLSVSLSGSLDLLLLEVPVSISADLTFPDSLPEFTVPQAVLDAIT